MNRGSTPHGGFSLIEVAITLGVMAFALIGLIGVFPLALEQGRMCVNETRGAQLARMVCATLESDPYTAAPCFAASGTGTLDLSTLSASSPPVVLFASYDIESNAQIVRTETAPANAEYRIELRFQPAPLSSGSGAGSVRGQAMDIKITAYPAQKSVVFEGVEFLSRLKRSIQPQ